MKKETKKKNNKKYLLPLFLICGIGLVLAGLVPYLSNTVNTEVTVSSPIEQLIDDGSGWSETDTISFNIFGGETIDFSVKDTNLANVVITGLTVNKITNPEGVNCSDFESVIITTTTVINGEVDSVSANHDLILYDSIDDRFCQENGANEIFFMYGENAPESNENTFEITQEDTSEISVTFKPNALGDYTFTSVINFPTA